MILKCGLCVLLEYHVLDVLETVHVYTVLDVLLDELLLQLRGIEYLILSLNRPTDRASCTGSRPDADYGLFL